MESLLSQLRASAEPTRLRLLALASRGAFCVVELTEILGQSQPRLSRHLRLLCEAGLLARAREGANVWFTLPSGSPDATLAATLVRELLARLPDDDAVLTADRRLAAQVMAERARVASDTFRRKGADWDEADALGLPAKAVEDAVLRTLPEQLGRLLDVGTGTGRLLELLAPRLESGVGVDASRAMLALARTRLARTQPVIAHCGVRQADMYRLPFPDCAFDTVALQMVLHYAEDPAGVLAEAARVLRPGGLLLVVELAAHHRTDLASRLAHRWPGFSDPALCALLRQSGLAPAAPVLVPGALDITLWTAHAPGAAPSIDHRVLETA